MTRRHSRLLSLCCCAVMAVDAGLAAQTPLTVIDVSAARHILVLLSDGTVMGAVDNSYGQLGRDVSNNGGSEPLARIALPAKAVQVVASGATSYALLDDGTVWAWGRGDAGELGIALPPGGSRATPGAVPGLREVKKITEGPLALLGDGTVMAWGHVGRDLTHSDSSVTSDPVPFPGLTDIVDLAGTTGLGIAITRNGRAVAWDLMDHPYLLPGGKEIAPAPPAEVAELREVMSVAVADHTVAAVTRDGSVWTWGQNAQGVLGNGARAANTGEPPQFAPGRVAGVTGAVAVKGSGRHYLVLRKDNTLVGWGNSDWGQLGAGVTGQFQLSPKAIALPNVAAFWPASNYSFARTRDGVFWFCGHREGAAAFSVGTRHAAVPAKVAPDRFK